MHRPTTPRRLRAFTLLELVIVIAILGLLASIVTVKAVAVLSSGQSTKVKCDLRTIVDAAKTLYAVRGVYPRSLSEMVRPKAEDGRPLPGFDELVPDPWGREYLYELRDGEPTAICLGRDGAEGGEGDDADTVVPRSREQ